jgi:hypothetical protein
MLKNGKRGLSVVLLFTLLLGGCGYYFPHIYNGNKLGLDNRIYQSLARWFQKSEAVNLTKDKSTADLILAGEIISIDLPSISWDGVSNATGTKVRLFVRYILKDLRSGAILWEVPRKLYTADYDSKTADSAADEAALKKIINDMSEDIYLGTLNKIRKQNMQVQTAN